MSYNVTAQPLAVDAGRSEVEARSKKGLVTFSSAVSKAGKMKNPQYLEGDLEIEIDGEKWWVADLAKREGKRFKRNNFGESKVNDPSVLKVQIIAAAIYSGLASARINLGTLVPIENYTKEERKKIRELLKGDQHFAYWLVEKNKQAPVEKRATLTINDKILITQEGEAAYWANPEDEDTQTLDFGAQTINYAFHRKDRVYINDLSGTIPEGWEILKDRHGLRDLEDYELDEKESRKIAEELAKKAIDEVNLKGWSPRKKTKVYGGVAHLVFEYIMKEFPRATIAANPRNGNVDGLYKLVLEVFENE